MEELTRLRLERGWSQQRLADESNVNKATINQIEKGRRSPNVETLSKLANALGAGVADFFPKAQAPLWSGDLFTAERRAYPYPWASDALDRLIKGWELEVEEGIDGRRAHAVAIAAIDALGAVLRVGTPGETLRDRVPENEVAERSRFARRLFELSQHAIDRYRASDAFEPDQERRAIERRERMKLVS